MLKIFHFSFLFLLPQNAQLLFKLEIVIKQIRSLLSPKSRAKQTNQFRKF